MDCKKSNKYRPVRQLLYIVCLMILSSCTWVQDDTDDCPYGFWLKLHYTYNMLDVDAAPKYLNDATVNVYDSEGHFVKAVYATQSELLANDYKVRIDDLPEGDYQFVVWSGVDESAYALNSTQEVDSFRLALNNNGKMSNTILPPLYHGYLSTVHYSDDYTVKEVGMAKNTNHLNCLIASVDNTVVLDPNEYTLKLESDNGVMDAHNNLVSDKSTVYLPYTAKQVTIEDPDYGNLDGLEYNISTLRLIADRKNRIILQKNSTSQILFNVDFCEYIGKVGYYYTNLGRELTLQEYLDRQDLYTVVFFLSHDLDELLQLQVNTWRLRSNNRLKLK